MEQLIFYQFLVSIILVFLAKGKFVTLFQRISIWVFPLVVVLIYFCVMYDTFEWETGIKNPALKEALEDYGVVKSKAGFNWRPIRDLMYLGVGSFAVQFLFNKYAVTYILSKRKQDY